MSHVGICSSEEEDSYDGSMSTKVSRPSRGVHLPFKKVSKEELEITNEHGERVVYDKAELVKMHQEKEAKLKRTRKAILDIQTLLQTLSDNFMVIASPCLCCCAVNHVADMITDCIETYEAKVEGRDKTADTDEKTLLVGGLMGRLKEHARRYSMAEHVIAEREKRFSEASLDTLWREIRSTDADIRRISEELDTLKTRMDRLRAGYKKGQHRWFLCRHTYYEQLIAEATIDCLQD